MDEIVLTKDSIVKTENNVRDKSLGVMSAFAVAWYSFCLLVFVMMVSVGEKAIINVYSAEQVEYLISTPFWVKAAQAVSTLAGLIGSVYLLLRRSSAYHWFALCLAALLVMIFDASLRGGFEIMGSSLMGISLIGFIVGIYLFWAAYSARNEGELSTT